MYFVRAARVVRVPLARLWEGVTETFLNISIPLLVLLTALALSPSSYSSVVLTPDFSLGFFADSAEEFANQLYLALTLSEQESLAMRQRARLSSKRFSVAAFEKGFGEVWKEVKEWVSWLYHCTYCGSHSIYFLDHLHARMSWPFLTCCLYILSSLHHKIVFDESVIALKSSFRSSLWVHGQSGQRRYTLASPDLLEFTSNHFRSRKSL